MLNSLAVCSLDNVALLADNLPTLEDRDVIRISLQSFYEIGATIEPLKHMKVGDSILMEHFAALYSAQEKLESLLNNSIIPLRTSYENGSALLEKISELIDKTAEVDDNLTHLEQAQFTETLTRFETVLGAELRILDTYFVSQKGGYSTIHLIEYGETLLPEETRRHMSAQAIADFKAGCRCLAFELSTAVGFHLLRVTESVLHDYFAAVAIDKTISATATMGTYIHNLKTNGGDGKVIGVLEQITNLHRNPLMHPQDSLTQNQALVLVGIVISAIVSMVEIVDAKQATAATSAATP